MSNKIADQTRKIILEHKARIAVVGMGYVGLPMAVEKAKVGFDVLGIEQNSQRADMINRGINYIPDVSNEDLKNFVTAGKISCETNFSNISSSDVVVICVPTPLTKNREPDISYITTVSREIARELRQGQLIVLESTTYPGTTSEVILPILEESSLSVGEDFFLAHSPERVDPGNKRYTTKNTSKVVGGVTPACLDIACAFYQQTIKQVVPVSSPAVAEMTKVFENTYRAVNIALVNEIMLLCCKMGLDVWEVVDAAGTKPFGIQTFYPGPGVGGHCIPIDPFYLTWKAREYDFHTRFIELAGEINIEVSYYVVEKITEALNQSKKALKGSSILILGIAYKKDVPDLRESPATRIIPQLLAKGADVTYHDPYIPHVDPRDNFIYLTKSVALTATTLREADCVVILTDHSGVDYDLVAENASVIVDTRNALKDTIKKDHIIKI